MKKLFKISLMISLSGILFDAKPVLAEMTPHQILKKADQARGNLEGVEWKVKIVSIKKGRKQYRTLRVKVRGFNALAEFISPPKVKGRKLLMIDRNMWFIKPGMRKPVPISPRQKLLGDASNGDIASTHYAEDYEITGVSVGTVNGEPCFLFDLNAVHKRATYDRIKYWISKERMVGVKSDFFTVSGKLFKSATFEYKNTVELNGQLKPFISKMIITNAVISSNVTIMSYSRHKQKKIPDSVFNLNLLVR